MLLNEESHNGVMTMHIRTQHYLANIYPMSRLNCAVHLAKGPQSLMVYCHQGLIACVRQWFFLGFLDPSTVIFIF